MAGNQLVDKLADVYDLFDIDGFNNDLANKGKKKGAVADAAASSAKDKKGAPAKAPEETKKKKKNQNLIKRRFMEKIT